MNDCELASWTPTAARVRVVAVVGSAGRLNPEVEALCHALGNALMDAGFRIVTGGCGGVMRAVSAGARESASWVEGRILGIVPSYRRSEANEYCDVVIPSGMQHARNVLVVSSADVVIAVDGGAGTLSELALAWQLGRPIVALGEAGWAGRLAGEFLDSRGSEPIASARTVDEATRLCLTLSESALHCGEIGDGSRKRGGT